VRKIFFVLSSYFSPLSRETSTVFLSEACPPDMILDAFLCEVLLVNVVRTADISIASGLECIPVETKLFLFLEGVSSRGSKAFSSVCCIPHTLHKLRPDGQLHSNNLRVSKTARARVRPWPTRLLWYASDVDASASQTSCVFYNSNFFSILGHSSLFYNVNSRSAMDDIVADGDKSIVKRDERHTDEAEPPLPPPMTTASYSPSEGFDTGAIADDVFVIFAGAKNTRINDGATRHIILEGLTYMI